MHRFGIDSLNDLLIHTPALREYQLEKENQEQTTLISEVDEEENQEQTTLDLSKTFENIEEPNRLKTSTSNGIFSKDQNYNNKNQLSDNQKLPLPNIKNFRKWINNDKKVS